MKEQIKYDPEDIESLLLHKEYKDLYQEEQEFVLKHLDNKEEYDSMRSMLLTISSTDDDNEIQPQNKTLDLLMEEFVTEEKRGFKWWLNSLFSGIFPQEKSWFLQPGFQMAMAMGIVVLGFIYFQEPDSTHDNIAEANTSIEKEIPKSDNAVKSDLTKTIETNGNNNDIEEPNTAVETEFDIDKKPISKQEIIKGNGSNKKPETLEKSKINDDVAIEDYRNGDRDRVLDIADASNNGQVEPTKTLLNEMEDVAADDDVAEVEIMEESVITSPAARAETNNFNLDQAIGNTTTPVSLEAIKVSSDVSNIAASKNLAANNDLISLLYTAP